MRKFAGLVAIAAAAVSAPAFAQSEGGIEPYVGVLVGYDNVKFKALGDSESQDGVVYGAVIGAQSRMGGNFVLGLEGEVTGASTKETARDVFEFGDRLRFRTGRDLFIGARAGVIASPGLLVYAKGGYTNGRVSLSYRDSTGSFKEGDNLDGYRLGAGAEFGEGRLRFRGEYRFSDYGNYRVQGINTGVSTQRHQIVAGAIYSF